jgi:hypothetical protein
VGFAELLRIHPDRFAAIRAALTEASEIGRALDVFRDTRMKPTDPRVRPFLLVKDGQKFRPPSEEEIEGREQLYLDVFKLATDPEDPIARQFQAGLPEHWKLQNKNVHPTLGLARVAENVAFIQHMLAKLQRTNLSTTKRAEIKQEIVSHLKYILSPKYVRYLKNANSWRTELRRLNASAQAGANVPSPIRNPRFYKKVLKSRQTGQAIAATRIGPGRYTTGQYPAKNIKVGAKMVGLENILPEYLFKKGQNINFGNLSAANINQVKNSQVLRWIEYIQHKIQSTKPINNSNLAKFNVILRGAINSRSKPLPANMSPTKLAIKMNKRTNIVNQARSTLEKLATRKAIRGGASKTPSSSVMNEKSAKMKILNAARVQLSPNAFKRTFPRGSASVAKYVRESAGPKTSIVNFSRTVNRPGSIQPR